jgi:hypothetical protein
LLQKKTVKLMGILLKLNFYLQLVLSTPMAALMIFFPETYWRNNIELGQKLFNELKEPYLPFDESVKNLIN